MNKFLLKTVILLGLLVPLAGVAQDDDVKAGVSVSLQNDEEVWAGQQVTVNLDLKTTGFSFSNSHFNLPEVDGAFLMQTDTTTIKLSEKVDGLTWQVVRYPLALYPQKAGLLEIPPIDVRFTTSAGFGTTETAFEFQSKPLEVAVKLPPGVKDGDLVITTASFELDYDWQPKSPTTQTGDAITLKVNRRASDISAMLLAPLPVFRSAGLAAYPQAPEVSDKTNRGDLTGERTDSIIWVIEKPGVYEIPGIRFQWWDPRSRELKQQIVPGLSLDVPSLSGENTLADSTTPSARKSRHLLPVLLVLLAGLLAIALWLRFGRKSPGQSPDNEKSAFTRLQKACEDNQASKAHADIHTWLAYCPLATSNGSRALTLSDFARRIDDNQLTTELEKLEEAVISPGQEWRGNEMLTSLKKVRQTITRQKTDRLRTTLAPLNP